MEKLSYICNPQTTQFVYSTVAQQLEKHKQLASREAFIFYKNDGSRSSITFMELSQLTRKFANTLIRHGLNKGERVAVALPNSIECVISMFAIMACGGVVGALSWEKCSGSDVRDYLNKLSCRFLITESKNQHVTHAFSEQIDGSGSFVDTDNCLVLMYGNQAGCLSTVKVNDILYGSNTDSTNYHLPDVFPDDEAVIFATSGTPGNPKPVVYTHFIILNQSYLFALSIGCNDATIYYCDRPFSWILGFPTNMASSGTTRVFMDTRMCNSSDYCQILCNVVQKEKCETVYMSGYVLHDLMQTTDFKKIENWKKVKLLYVAGQRLNIRAISLIGEFCDKIVNLYGSTEMGPTCSLIIEGGDYLVGDAGYPLPGVEFKIIDENGQILPINSTGEINCRGISNFLCYLNNDNATEKVRDTNTRWLKTGDVGHITDNGRLVIEGRKSDFISRGTRKILPAAIEEEVQKCAGVAAVCVVPVPDKRLLEEVCLCVIKKPESVLTAKILEQFCGKIFLKGDDTLDCFGLQPGYFLIMECFPQLPNGKHDKSLLSHNAASILGLLQ